MLEAKKDYILDAINELSKLIGVKENINRQSIYKLFQIGKLDECARTIADYFELPIKLNVIFVSRHDGLAREYLQGKSSRSIDWNQQSGNPGTIAQVSIPDNLPLLGSKELIDFPINIKIFESAKILPDTFFCIIAHELSHVLLAAIRHNEKDNEIYTDIVAMLLGFCEIAKNGRKIQNQQEEHTLFSTTTYTNITTYGYLADRSFIFAYYTIDDLLSELKKINKNNLRACRKLTVHLQQIKKCICKFKAYLSKIDIIRNTNINPIDAKKIVLFHEIGHFSEIENFVTIQQNEILYEINKSRNIKHYFPCVINNLRSRLVSKQSQFKQKKISIKKDMKIVKKYISYHMLLTVWLRNFWN